MLQNIALLVAASGPQIVTKPVTIGDVTQPVRIKRVTFAQAQELNSMLLGADGKMDLTKFGAYRIALIAATVVGDDDKPACTAEEVGTWPVALVEALEAAVKDVNGMKDGAAQEVEKNS